MSATRVDTSRTTDAVTVSLAGGLGNQLFGYALGLQLSEQNRCELHLEMGTLGTRRLELGEIPLPSHARLVAPGNRARDHIVRAVGRLPIQHRIVQERGFAFDPELLSLRPPVRLHGYFQSWRYFTGVADDLRRQVRHISAPSAPFTRLAEALADGFVAVHVRRGDFLDAAGYHGNATDRYFAEAHRLANPSHLPTVVFTDDASDWKPSWEGAGDAMVLRPRDLPSARETLVLMSKAAGLVLSNSSFAWWAAWIADAPGRTVVAPRPWFATTKPDTRDLLPLSWLTLDMRDE